jgi:hypothetical protein
MGADISRQRFDHLKDFSAVLKQQGRVDLDSDWNEYAEILDRRFRAETTDVAGRCLIGRETPDAFKISVSGTTNAQHIMIGTGRIYVDGILADNHGVCSPDAAPPPTFDTVLEELRGSLSIEYPDQPHHPPDLPNVSSANESEYIAYLDVWRREVTHHEDTDLIESAVGVDTTCRVQNVWQVKLCRVEGGESITCGSDSSEWNALVAAPGGRLSTQAIEVDDSSSPCLMKVEGGYTGLENQLYRVEIHSVEGAGKATFKWSRDNASVATIVKEITLAQGATTISVESVGKDAVLGFAIGDWIEITDDRREFAGLAGEVRKISNIDPKKQTISFTDALSFVTPGIPDTKDHVRVRRWDQKEMVRYLDGTTSRDLVDLSTISKDGVIPMVLGKWILLERGVAVMFTLAQTGGFRPADFWVFAARSESNSVETLTTAPPRGIHHHYARLAILKWDANVHWKVMHDCRPRLAGKSSCCTLTVGDGSTSFGDFDSLDEAVANLPSSHAQICLLPGLHETNARIRGKSDIVIRGCGSRTKLVAHRDSPSDPVLRIEDSAAVAIEDLDLSAFQGAGIVIHGSTNGSVNGIRISDTRIVARTSAIRITNATHIVIRDNYLRVLDTVDGGMALFLAADDCCVERNDVLVLHSRFTPPATLPGHLPLFNIMDQAAKLKDLLKHPGAVIDYINAFWMVPSHQLQTFEFKGKGGIQVAGGSEGVIVRGNRISGGSGNGITLGSLVKSDQSQIPPKKPFHVISKNGFVMGQVQDATGQRLSGVHLNVASAGGQGEINTISGASGEFTVWIPDGEYLLSVVSDTMDIQKGESVPSEKRQYYLITLQSVEAAIPEGFGFLYDIALAGNTITDMGLNGIGLPSAAIERSMRVASEAATTEGWGNLVMEKILETFGTPVLGLQIVDNHILRCLQAPVESWISSQRGMGGISLGLCGAVSISGNTIEKNGPNHLAPVCGVFAVYVEELEVVGNHILDNGPIATVPAEQKMQKGHRGGIVVVMASAFRLFELLTTGSITSQPLSVAARIRENEVRQPAGMAIEMAAIGPLSCSENVLESSLSGSSDIAQLVGTMMLLNLGGVQYSGTGGSSATVRANANKAVTKTRAATAKRAGPMVLATQVNEVVRPAVTFQLFPRGETMVAHNQVRSLPTVTSRVANLILTFDDISLDANQFLALQGKGVLINTMVASISVRALGNRLIEALSDMKGLSLFTLSTKMNLTSLNQADHCIDARNGNVQLPDVASNNQILNPVYCKQLLAGVRNVITVRG